jgi:hypothetical protein
MATVYLAEDLKHHRRVAVKVLRAELAAALGPERFLREIEIGAQLHHPHILPLYDSGEAAGFLYYVMPYVEGESLRDRLAREKQLPLDDALQITREVADALSYAHNHDVVHRDIKPENILLESGHAVVADFGIARAISAAGGENLTETGIALGTPAYMSPEQAAGSKELDGRSDLYSLGCVLYEMLAGQPPFTGPTVQSLTHQHLTVEPPPVTNLRPAVPTDVAGLLARVLAKTPADRFSPAAQFAEALAASSRATAGVPRNAAASGRHGKPVIAGAAVVVVLAAVGFVIRFHGTGAVPQETVAALQTAAQEGRLDEVYGGLTAAGLELGDPRVQALAELVAGTVAIETDPPGVPVSLWRVEPIATFPTHPAIALGKTPVEERQLVAGEYLLQLAPLERDTLTLLVDVAVRAKTRVRKTLLPTGGGWDGMALVERGLAPLEPSGPPVPAFLIDRHEVTNAEFGTFVAAGGYGDSTYWPRTLLVDHRPTPWRQGVGAFVDRTGLPGPRGWSSGTFPPDRANHPVTGVSWYEAAAYARWVGKELPSRAQWYRAALGDGDHVYPWGRDARSATRRANFNLAGTSPVGSLPLGVSPFGCFDMAGNVREWLRDETAEGGRYFAAGGSWEDPTYMFFADHLEPFDPAFAGPGLGLRLVTGVPTGP